METDKTGETDCLGNAEFLAAIFGAEASDNCPVVVSFAGNPQEISRHHWYGKAWPQTGAGWAGGSSATPVTSLEAGG